jgi:hypothetical protein
MGAMAEAFDPYLQWLGLRDTERPPNHYRLLGVAPFEDDPEVLGHAADRQMAHVRTFQTGKHSAESQRLLNELAAAKVCLLNPVKKAAYDARLRAAVEVRQPAAAPTARPAAGQSTPTATPVARPAAVVRPATPPPAATTVEETLSWRHWIVVATIPLFVIVAVAVWAIVTVNSGGDKPADKDDGVAAAGPKPVLPSKTEPPPKPKPTPPKSEAKPAKPTPKSAAKPLEKTPSKPTPKPLPAPARPPRPKPDVARRLACAKSLQAARDAIRTRVVGSVRTHLAEARSNAQGEQVAEVERLRAICDCLEQFCAAFKSGRLRLKPGNTVQAGGRMWTLLPESSGGRLTLSDGRARCEGSVHTLPATMAIAIAEPFLPPSSDANATCKAAVLLFGEPVDRQQVERLCEMASQENSTVQALWAELNASAASDIAATVRQPFERPSPGEDKLQPPPAEEAQEKARQEIHELFKEQYAAARDNRNGALALAEKLRQQAVETGDNPAARYVLYVEAADMAAAAGDADLLYDALAALSREYHIDGYARAAETLEGAAKKQSDPDACQALGRLALALAQNAADGENYLIAVRLIETANEFARKGSGPTAARRLLGLLEDIAERQKLKTRFPEIEKVLADKPDDPDANRAAAEYYCLVKNDWRHGLKLAVKSGDPAIRAAAQWELDHPSDKPAKLAALGDRWYDAWKAAQPPHRRLAQVRAVYCYRHSVGTLSGMSQNRVLHRLAELNP